MQDSENPCRPELDELIRKIRNFVEERDWDQFHSPKNLAMALAVEASELVEIFQWMTEEESQQLDPKRKQYAEEEIADVMTYLIRISDRLDIDLLAAVERKLAINQKKYPANLVRGNSKKYTEYKF
jgi:NTP pyrophosphatase (non-canonical NTP hydrolase)